MNRPTEETAIEVEVLEVDGVPVPPEGRKSAERRESGTWKDWTAWQGRVRRLDPRWWPLWLFLGILLFTVLVTLGLVAGMLFVAWRLVIGVGRALLGVFNPDRGLSQR